MSDDHSMQNPQEAGEESPMEDYETYPFLKADHAMFAPLQKALNERLDRKRRDLEETLKDREEGVRQLDRHLEEVGNSLYNRQHQLGQQQALLEGLNENIHSSEARSSEQESQLKGISSELDSGKRALEDRRVRLEKARSERNQALSTLRQVEQYNEKIAAEIAVNRRIAHKGEAALKELESGKKWQDYAVDELTDQIRRITEDASLLDGQITAQKKEKEQAMEMIREASKQLDELKHERKQVQLQWQSNLIAIQRRDEAIHESMNAIHAANEKSQSCDNLERAVRADIEKEEGKDEKYSNLLSKNEFEIKKIQKDVESAKNEREALAEEYALLKKANESALQETARINLQQAEEGQEQEILDKQYQKLVRQLSLLKESTMDLMGEKTTIDRAAANTLNVAKQISQQDFTRETEIHSIENEAARVRIDTLNARAHNAALREKLKLDSAQLVEMEKLAEQHETEIRRKHHLIEKKQLFVDRLNRDYDVKKSKVKEAELAAISSQLSLTLDGKFKALKKSIAETTNDSHRMQKDWITRQTELVNISHGNDKLAQRIEVLRTKKLVLEEKRRRLLAHVEKLTKEVKAIERDTRHLRMEMDRMNILRLEHEKKENGLASQIISQETDFGTKLKTKEAECAAAVKQSDEIKAEIDKLQEEIIEAEKMSMLWERKLRMEADMQEALDPTVGQSEAAEMKREIHRMELRLEEMKRKQNDISRLLVRSVSKKDLIELKYEKMATKTITTGVRSGNSAGNAAPIIPLQQSRRQVENLQKRIQDTTSAVGDADGKLSQIEEDRKAIVDEIDNIFARVEDLRSENAEASLGVEVKRIRAQQLACEAQISQKMTARYEQLLRDSANTVAATAAQMARAIAQQSEQQKNERESILATVDEASEKFPRFKTAWEELRQWLTTRSVTAGGSS